jgi:hypothetical protein
MKLSYFGKIDLEGNISLPKRMRVEMAQSFKGRHIEVIIQNRKKIRSSPLNRYYWGHVIQVVTIALYEFAPENGKNPETTHQMFKEWFLPLVAEPPVINLPNGEIKKGVYSTTVLTNSEFKDYLMFISKWCAEYNIIIADPDPMYWDKAETIDIDKN